MRVIYLIKGKHIIQDTSPTKMVNHVQSVQIIVIMVCAIAKARFVKTAALWTWRLVHAHAHTQHLLGNIARMLYVQKMTRHSARRLYLKINAGCIQSLEQHAHICARCVINTMIVLMQLFHQISQMILSQLLFKK
jgi:hypothetical protein